MNATSAREIHRVERWISDLTHLCALSETWGGQSAAHVLSTLGDALVRTLGLTFVYVRLNERAGREPCEIVRREAGQARCLSLRSLKSLLSPWLQGHSGSGSGAISDPCKPGKLAFVSIPFGVRDRIGTLIAGARRDSFPSDRERLLLGVIASRACVALHEYLRDEAQRLSATAVASEVARRTLVLTEANRELQILKDELAIELGGMARLHEFSNCLLEQSDERMVLEHMLDAIMELQQASFGTVQLNDPQQGGLLIAAQRNFLPDFVEHFAREGGAGSDWAAREGTRVVIEDVQSDERSAPHRQVARAAGFRAVQSTPLIGHLGNLLGVVSTHFRERHRPTDTELRLTDLYVRHATQTLERKRAEEERNRLAAIVENSSDFIGIASLAGKPCFLNAAGRKMLGLRAEEPIPPDILTYVTTEDAERLTTQIMPIVEREGFWDGELTLRHFDSAAEIPVLQHIFYIRNAVTGNRTALATVCRDMTERKRAQRAVSQAQQELAHANRVLGMGELATSIAHELNQPLAAIVANSNACRRWIERDAPEIDQARISLDKIIRDAQRASEIIRRIRDFSTKAAPARGALNLDAVIHEVLAITADEMARDHILVRTLGAERPPFVVADRVELQQVVLNLVINSMEALRPVTDRPRHLSITTVRRESATIEVAVRDDGIGVAPQLLPKLFEPLFTTKAHGMGLGLSISRRIIESHGGKMRVTANEHHGLTLSFTLPAIEAP